MTETDLKIIDALVGFLNEQNVVGDVCIPVNISGDVRESLSAAIAVLKTLPVTKDGVIVHPARSVFCPNGAHFSPDTRGSYCYCARCAPDTIATFYVMGDCYSTCEAALAADAARDAGGGEASHG